MTHFVETRSLALLELIQLVNRLPFIISQNTMLYRWSQGVRGQNTSGISNAYVNWILH